MRKIVLAVVLALLFLPLSETVSKAASSFNDVSTSHRAYKEIKYLFDGKIVTGSLDGYFNPGKVVTRGEAAAMIGRALNLNGTKRSTKFSDVGSQYFASGYIQAAADAKVITGYKDGSFKPNNPVNRGEMAVILSKAFNYNFGGTLSGAAKALMTRGISGGMADGTFGSELATIRADFSVFLARAINYKLRLNPTENFSLERTVTASSLNVRSGPSTAYPAVGSLVKGTKVEVAYSVGQWVYVRSVSTEGLVHSAYLDADIDTGNEGNDPADNILSQQMIVIDAGHGGHDPGAIGYGLKEKDVVLNTALKVKALLAKSPFQYKLTRDTDVYLTLDERVDIAEDADADVFVSIHANAFNGSAKGSETYYYAAKNTNSADSKLLATKIQDRLIAAGKLSDRGVKNGNFHVLRENGMPAVLTELGFIDNKGDNAKLASPSWRDAAAKAIYYGILDYYKAKGFDVSNLY
ncbi:MAG: N-acetylmuramoyl-L-alanine amidase [Cytobacillus gottheilii]|uniref:N-acetylmuramoyl-L-alanine amidase n=1 Tax=Cytobacillus gottheilii TaxID=859144 RepID=UPI003463D444